jgi:hypothetical protein
LRTDFQARGQLAKIASVTLSFRLVCSVGQIAHHLEELFWLADEESHVS